MVPFTKPEVIRLLSGDTTKSWLRVSFKMNGEDQGLNECDLHNITNFYIDASDSLKYRIVSNPADCQWQIDTLEAGYWRILGRDDNNEIAEKIEFVFEGDTTQHQIKQVTSLYLILNRSKEDLFFETAYETVIPE
jgi:hypothetical protein